MHRRADALALLHKHFAFVIDALKPIADELGM
jgi:predicted hydrolase (HD superfamily)